MCLAASTLVPFASGQDNEMCDLRHSAVPIYTCSDSARILMSYAAIRARDSAECLRIELDDGAEIACGPTQNFMLRDGTYAAAGSLQPGVSLMPLYTKRDKDGYAIVQQNYSGRWQKAHWIAARCGLLGAIPRFVDQRTVIHHKNFDRADNAPENLEFMGANDHSAYHRSIAERNEQWQSREFEARRVEALAAKAATPEGHAYFAERGTRNIKAYMARRPEHFRAAVAGNGRRGARHLVAYNRSEQGKSKSRQLANAEYPCDICGEYVKSYIGLHNHRRWKHGRNHKIVAVKPGGRVELVCISTPNNIGLCAGVFAAACAEPSQG